MAQRAARIWSRLRAAFSSAPAVSLLILASATPVTAQRLPRSVFPVHYDLTLAPDLAAERFIGDATITVSVQQPVSAITLNAVGLTINSASITSNGREHNATITNDAPAQQITLNVGSTIQPGPAAIHIAWTASLDRNLRGFYVGHAMNRNYASTQFESTDARRAFPSFDEPEFKATFAVSTIVDEGDAAFSNGDIVSDTPGPGPGKRTIRFSTTPRISSYLVALTVGPFDCTRGEVDGIPLRVCATRDKVEMTRFALEATKPIVSYYNRYFGIRYPFGKLDQIAIPDFAAGAMENAGSIIFRETALLADPKTATPSQQKNVSSVIAHEIAHQWFGDLVTMKWWNDIWLNEGFATFMTPKAVGAWKPEWQVWNDVASASGYAMDVDVLRSTRAMRADANTPAEIDQLFDAIAYNKTAAVMRMLEAYIGEEAFRDSIRGYFATNAFANTAMEDFARAMEKGSSKPIAEVISSFVRQPGIPLVTVDERCDNGRTSMTLTQQRMFIDYTSVAPANELWTIPICYERNGTRTCELLREKKQTFRVAGCDPLFINPDARGYFVTRYSPATTRRLLAGSLGETEKLAIVRDEWYLTRAGQRDVADFLRIADALRGTEGLVLEPLLADLNAIGRDFLTPPSEPKYRAWVRNYVRPLAERYGWTPRAGETRQQQTTRTEVLRTLGLTGRDAATLDKATTLARQALKDPSSVDMSVIDTVHALAAARSDPSLYEAVLDAYSKTADPVLLSRYRHTLATYRDPKLALRTLDWTLSPSIRSQDMSGILTDVLRTREVAPQAWTWLEKHWDEVVRKMPAGIGGSSASSLVGAIGAICDPAVRERALALFAGHPIPGTDRRLAQVREQSATCIAIRQLQAPKLEAWAR